MMYMKCTKMTIGKYRFRTASISSKLSWQHLLPSIKVTLKILSEINHIGSLFHFMQHKGFSITTDHGLLVNRQLTIVCLPLTWAVSWYSDICGHLIFLRFLWNRYFPSITGSRNQYRRHNCNSKKKKVMIISWSRLILA